MESAYNSLYLFDMSVARWSSARRHSHRFMPDEFFFMGLAANGGFQFPDWSSDEITPDYRLELKEVSIQSPGFWEFVGGLNPLQQIREFLKDRHERRKDREYRESAEKERLRLDNELLQRQIHDKETGTLRDQVLLLQELGFGEDVLREIVWARIGPPLAKLGQHQDKGLIEGPMDSR
jgi:hypothetical protein